MHTDRLLTSCMRIDMLTSTTGNLFDETGLHYENDDVDVDDGKPQRGHGLSNMYVLDVPLQVPLQAAADHTLQPLQYTLPVALAVPGASRYVCERIMMCMRRRIRSVLNPDGRPHVDDILLERVAGSLADRRSANSAGPRAELTAHDLTAMKERASKRRRSMLLEVTGRDSIYTQEVLLYQWSFDVYTCASADTHYQRNCYNAPLATLVSKMSCAHYHW
jgi:hypothetical protein